MYIPIYIYIYIHIRVYIYIIHNIIQPVDLGLFSPLPDTAIWQNIFCFALGESLNASYNLDMRSTPIAPCFFGMNVRWFSPGQQGWVSQNAPQIQLGQLIQRRGGVHKCGDSPNSWMVFFRMFIAEDPNQTWMTWRYPHDLGHPHFITSGATLYGYGQCIVTCPEVHPWCALRGTKPCEEEGSEGAASHMTWRLDVGMVS